MVFLPLLRLSALNLFTVVFLFSWTACHSSAEDPIASTLPEDPSEETKGPLVQIGPNWQSSSIGFFGVSPESPNGERIAYIRYIDNPRNHRDSQMAELWVCDSDNTNHRKVCVIPGARPHNGAEQSWLDDEHVVFSTRPPTFPRHIMVANVDTGEIVAGPIVGISDLGHEGHNGTFLFAHDRRGQDYAENPLGVYLYDLKKNETIQLFSLEDLIAVEEIIEQHFPELKGTLYPWDQRVIFHLQFSPDGSKVAFRFDTGDGRAASILVFFDRRTEEFSIFPTSRPLHWMWYDNESIKGHCRIDSSLILTRYSLDGEIMEVLGPAGNHLGASPDLEFFASESRASSTEPVVLKYFRSGDPDSVREIMEHHFHRVTWDLRFHLNPAFSRDGRRIYFHKPLDNEFNSVFFYERTKEP